MASPSATARKSRKQELPPDALRDFFRRTPLLKEVARADIEGLMRDCTVWAISKGSVIFRPGEPSNWMYFIYSGFVVEFVGYGSSVDIIVKTRRPYDYIGEMGMLIDQPYPNTAVAMENLVLVALPRRIFLDLTWKHPAVSRHIIGQLIERLNNSARKMINTMYLDAPGRLAFTVVSISGDMAGHRDKISITQTDLAASAGIARQTVAKILGDWRREGWISTVRGQIAVRDLDALLDIIVSSELR